MLRIVYLEKIYKDREYLPEIKEKEYRMSIRAALVKVISSKSHHQSYMERQ